MVDSFSIRLMLPVTVSWDCRLTEKTPMIPDGTHVPNLIEIKPSKPLREPLKILIGV